MLKSRLRTRQTRRVIVAAVVAMAVATPVQAQQNSAGSACVDVRIGAEQFYDCLNQDLQRTVSAWHAPVLGEEVHPDSPAPATGSFNRAATQERLGSAFGHSLQPQRTTTAVPSPPLAPPR